MDVERMIKDATTRIYSLCGQTAGLYPSPEMLQYFNGVEL
jgi:hypothetical protein